MASPIQFDATPAAVASNAAPSLDGAIMQQSEGPNMAVDFGHTHSDYVRRSSIASQLASLGLQLNDNGEIEVVYALQHGSNAMMNDQQSQPANAIAMAPSQQEPGFVEPTIIRDPLSKVTSMPPSIHHAPGVSGPLAVQEASQPPLMGRSSSSTPSQHGNGHAEQAGTNQVAQEESETMGRAADREERKKKRQEKLGKLGNAVKGVFGIAFVLLQTLGCAGVLDN